MFALPSAQRVELGLQLGDLLLELVQALGVLRHRIADLRARL